MKTRILDPAQEEKLAQWLRENRARYQFNHDAVRAGFVALFPELHYKPTNSAIVSKYIRKAGLSQAKAVTYAGKNPDDADAVTAIHDAEQAIQKAVRLLDDERNVLSARVLEIDNLIAKYRNKI